MTTTQHQAPEAMTDERAAFEQALTKMPAWAPEYEQHRPWVNALLWFIWHDCCAMWSERLRAQPAGQWGDTQHFKREIGEESDWTPCTHAEYVRLSKDPHHDTKAVTEKPTKPAGQIDPDAERKKARADLNLYGVGFLVDGRHVPAMRVSAIWGDNKPAGQAGGEHPLSRRCYVMSETHLSGARLTIGFNTIEEADDAHTWVANLRKPTAPQQQAGGEVVAALVLEKIDTLVATINGAHTAKSDGWREGCWAAADLALGEIKGLLATPAPEPKAEPVRNNPISALAIRILVESGRVTQADADSAFTVACAAMEDEAEKMNVTLPWVTRKYDPATLAEPVRVPEDVQRDPSIRPPAGVFVLAWVKGVKLPIRAQWVPEYFLEAGEEFDPDWGQYSEEKDQWFCPEGWYEANHYEETNWQVDGEVIAWMALPTLTAAQAQAKGGAA